MLSEDPIEILQVHNPTDQSVSSLLVVGFLPSKCNENLKLIESTPVACPRWFMLLLAVVCKSNLFKWVRLQSEPVVLGVSSSRGPQKTLSQVDSLLIANPLWMPTPAGWLSGTSKNKHAGCPRFESQDMRPIVNCVKNSAVILGIMDSAP
jgi:hypothetical protein